jgi:hypothetical protein
MYYSMDSMSFKDGMNRFVGHDPVALYRDIKFYSAQWIDEKALRLPLPYALTPMSEYELMVSKKRGIVFPIPDYNDGTLPLVSEGFADHLRAFPVRNLQFIPAVLTDPDSGKVYTNYLAMNILGAISAADMAKSRYAVHDGVPIIDVSFDKLVLDESRALEAPIFRLVESGTVVLVHQRLRDHILKKFPNMCFYETGDIAVP